MRPLWRRLTAVIFTAMLILTMAAPVSATHLGGEDNPAFHGWFTNSAIGDGQLSQCFEPGTPVYTNRSTLSLAIQEWNDHINLTFTSDGACDATDQSNIEWNWGIPHPLGGCGAVFNQLGGGYSQISIYISDTGCSGKSWSWLTSGAAPAGQIQVWTTAVHEGGHALGLDHENANGGNGHNDIMDQGWCLGPNGYARGGSENDIRSIRARYPGLAPVGGNGNLNGVCQFP